MAQQVKGLLQKSADLSPGPRTHVKGGRRGFPQTSLWVLRTRALRPCPLNNNNRYKFNRDVHISQNFKAGHGEDVICVRSPDLSGGSLLGLLENLLTIWATC